MLPASSATPAAPPGPVDGAPIRPTRRLLLLRGSVAAVAGLCAVNAAVSGARFGASANTSPVPVTQAVDPPSASAPKTVARSSVPVLSARRAAALVVAIGGRAQLERTVAALTAGPRLGARGASASCVMVRDGGRTIVAHQADLAVLPASALKVLTALAVLDKVGSTTRFATAVRSATAPVDGVVAGDLWLVGGGDPLLATKDYLAHFSRQPQIATSFEELADGVVATGITRVTGAIVGDERLFDARRGVATWKRSYRTSGEVGPLSALMVNDGFARADGSAVWLAVADPSMAAADKLAQLLGDRGVVVVGPSRSASAADPAASAAAPNQITAVESPPLSEVVREMLTESDNTTAELMIKRLGLAASGTGSTAAGVVAMRQVLETSSLPMAGAVFHDGSGLDRGNRVTCALLAEAIEKAPPELIAGLSVGGQSGTLRDRMRAEDIRGKVSAKTGTLNGVSALVGTATTRGSSQLHFAMVLNNLAPTVSGVEVGDELAAALVRFPDGPTADELAP